MVDVANEEREMACVDLRGLGGGDVGPCLSDRDTVERVEVGSRPCGRRATTGESKKGG